MSKGTRGNATTAFGRLVGPSKSLPNTDLGTKRDVLQQALHLRFLDSRDAKNYPKAEVCNDTVKHVKENWTKVNKEIAKYPVIVSDREISRKILALWTKVEEFTGKHGGKGKRKKSDQIPKHKAELESDLDKLFDILACSCEIKTCEEFNCSPPDDEICEFKAHILCLCLKQFKIPKLELGYIRDQRLKVGTKGHLQIGKVDVKESLRQINAEKRKKSEAASNEGKDDNSNIETPVPETENFDSDNEENNNTDDVDWNKVDKKIEKQNRVKLTETVKAGMRFGISSRGMATLSTCTLIDNGIVTCKDPHLIIDHHKIEREKTRVMEMLRENDKKNMIASKLECLFFDGKKDKTKVRFEVEGSDKVYMGIQKEEHISMCKEPGGDYLHHFTPGNATKDTPPAKVVALGMTGFLKEVKQDSNLLAMGGDSTNTNTGYKGGSIHFVEVELGRRLLWIICFLHCNELPLRHLIIVLDGPTSSDNTFSGPLGKALQNVEDLDYNPNFKPIKIGPGLPELDQKVIDDLSTDQQYGYNLVLCIMAGKVSQQILLLAIGKMSHARWLNTANRLMRLWVSKHMFKGKDLKNLEMIVEFIIAVYYPMWFDAKIKHHVTNGPHLVLNQIKLINSHIKPAAKKIVLPYVNSSAWFSHPEHILLALLSSQEETDRHFAVKKILNVIRGKDGIGDTSVRTYRVPEIDWKATKIQELIDWKTTPLFEPIVTATMSADQVRGYLDKPLVLPDWPCHGQSVERTVKKTSEASLQVAGAEKRDGWIRGADDSRKRLPKMETKKDYKSLLVLAHPVVLFMLFLLASLMF